MLLSGIIHDAYKMTQSKHICIFVYIVEQCHVFLEDGVEHINGCTCFEHENLS